MDGHHDSGSDGTPVGSFAGIDVGSGRGGGLAVGAPVPSGRTTHFHAARLPQLGDTVLAVTRTFDRETAAALEIELRAFAAAAAARRSLVDVDAETFLQSSGAVGYGLVELAGAGDAPDQRRPARLVRCVVSDAAPTADAARGVADWLRTTWETELSFGSWPAVDGSLQAFALDGGAAPSWAGDWLARSSHHVDAQGNFLKVLAQVWLEPLSDGAAAAQAAVDG